MPHDELTGSDGGGKPASQAYWNALRKLKGVWWEVFHEELNAQGSRAKEAFDHAIELIGAKRLEDGSIETRLRNILDIAAQDDIAEALLTYVDLDDLPPNEIKRAMYDECRRCKKGRVDLRTFLRSVLDALFDGTTSHRPNVGANRHWPRLLQYLRELEGETDWSPDGCGFRLINSGGRGPVAHDPRDPGRLCALIDPEYL